MENGIQPAGEALIQNTHPFSTIEQTVDNPMDSGIPLSQDTPTNPVAESGKGGLVDVMA